MLSSLKGDGIVKGIPTYILAITIVVPVLLFSGAIGGIQLGPGSSGTGAYDFLNSNWRNWSENEWDLLLDILMEYDEDEDELPPQIEDFASKLENMSEYELSAFWGELENRMMDRYGQDYYQYY